jgi:hypothetical protein
LSWETGEPAISRDGRHVAVVLRAERAPPRLVVWRTGPDTVPPRRRPARPRRRPPPDPLDVPDRQFYPPPKRAVATLRTLGARAYEEPRFFADGDRILVSRLEPRGDGSLVFDLSVWDFRRRTVRRVTRGAGVRAADPSPDGRTAAATRCARGRCDLVSIDLATGAIRPLLSGTPEISYQRPRYSPDGRRIVVSVQQHGRWRVAVVDVASRTLRLVDPDDGTSRYDVAWLPGGRSLLWVSERGGIPNVETTDLDGRTPRPLTRVTGAALAPEPNPADGSIWFLSLHSRGLDVRRLVPDSSRVERRVDLPEHLAPAVPVRPAFRPDTLRRGSIGMPRPYALGPRQSRWFPGLAATADGIGGEAVIANADPVGRVALRIGGAFGQRGVWQGASLAATVRRRGSLTAQAYLAQQEPSRRFVGDAGRALDLRLTGGDVRVELLDDRWEVRHRFRLGGAVGSLRQLPSSTPPLASTRTRALGFAELRGTYRQRIGELRLSQTLSAHADAGGLGRDRFTRGLVGAGFSASGPLPLGGIQGSVAYGALSGTSDPVERFTVGGTRSSLVDAAVLPQRLDMPALPTGTATGDRVFAFRVSLPTGPLAPYYWGASTALRSQSFDRWHRVVGAELRLGSEAIPLVALPDVQLVAGYGRSLDPPYRKGNRVYAVLTYR